MVTVKHTRMLVCVDVRARVCVRACVWCWCVRAQPAGFCHARERLLLFPHKHTTEQDGAAAVRRWQLTRITSFSSSEPTTKKVASSWVRYSTIKPLAMKMLASLSAGCRSDARKISFSNACPAPHPALCHCTRHGPGWARAEPPPTRETLLRVRAPRTYNLARRRQEPAADLLLRERAELILEVIARNALAVLV